MLSTSKEGEASCRERSGLTQSAVFEQLIDGTLQPPQRALRSWRMRVSYLCSTTEKLRREVTKSEKKKMGKREGIKKKNSYI